MCHFSDALADYQSAVDPTALQPFGASIPSVANYLNEVHQRIHSVFSDRALSSLDVLPKSHPLSDRTLHTTLELVLDRQGRLIARGVVRSSGQTAFDVTAIDAVERAAPFGPVPREILSPDGNLYVHWSFFRDQRACSTRGAHPFKLTQAN